MYFHAGSEFEVRNYHFALENGRNGKNDGFLKSELRPFFSEKWSQQRQISFKITFFEVNFCAEFGAELEI